MVCVIINSLQVYKMTFHFDRTVHAVCYLLHCVSGKTSPFLYLL